mmetsp:Transcript_28709/g.86821  ORF Transcript_28709/g.86821 Transcript_28709/m.86821 type:complete len:214 (-) Transcript_28709:82-723(-)
MGALLADLPRRARCVLQDLPRLEGHPARACRRAGEPAGDPSNGADRRGQRAGPAPVGDEHPGRDDRRDALHLRLEARGLPDRHRGLAAHRPEPKGLRGGLQALSGRRHGAQARLHEGDPGPHGGRGGGRPGQEREERRLREDEEHRELRHRRHRELGQLGEQRRDHGERDAPAALRHGAARGRGEDARGAGGRQARLDLQLHPVCRRRRRQEG